jgi:predicted nucleic acid-binding protein
MAKRARPAASRRYTVDASVFVNACNPHEHGHAASLEALTAIQRRGDPMVVPSLLVTEIAAALARATDDPEGAVEYAQASVALPHLTLVPITPTVARQAADLAARHRLRAADAVYLVVAQRYGTTLLSRDAEQRQRGAAITPCQAPEEAISDA